MHKRFSKIVFHHTSEYPRNSEGAMVELKDGKLLFVFSRFTEGGGDNDRAHLARTYSEDGGRTWSEPDVVVETEGRMNVMSVSLLRLASGELMMSYLRKNSTSDCRPVVRFSHDEGRTWSEPVEVTEEVCYYVVNNDRVVQLSSGRLVMPVAVYCPEHGKHGVAPSRCFISDDGGRTWRMGKGEARMQEGVDAQEPGVVELEDGRLMMLIRNRIGYIYRSYSEDGGETWTTPESTGIPCAKASPISCKRIPSTGHLLMVWNHRPPDSPEPNRRTPLTCAVSRDEGKTWENLRDIETDPDRGFCYTSILFRGDEVVLSYCAGLYETGILRDLKVTIFGVEDLYR